MLARDMHVRSMDGTFQNRPKPLNALSVMDAFNPFLGAVVHRAVRVTVTCQLGIGLQFIGAYRRPFFTFARMCGSRVARRTLSTILVITSPWRSSIPKTTVLPGAPRPRLPPLRLPPIIVSSASTWPERGASPSTRPRYSEFRGPCAKRFCSSH